MQKLHLQSQAKRIKMMIKILIFQLQMVQLEDRLFHLENMMELEVKINCLGFMFHLLIKRIIMFELIKDNKKKTQVIEVLILIHPLEIEIEKMKILY